MFSRTTVDTSSLAAIKLSTHKRLHAGDREKDATPATDQATERSVQFPEQRSLTNILSIYSKFLYAFVPQLLRSWIWKDHVSQSKHFATAYFNGLRGICAIKVYTFHYMYAHSRATSRPWGSGPRYHHFLQLPIIRWLFAGSTSHIFFGIGGYLMSVRLLQLMAKGDQSSHAKIFQTISTSLFRRIFRLYLPLAAMTLLTSILIYLGMFEYTRTYTMSPKRRRYFAGGGAERIAPRMPTLAAQLTHWTHDLYQLTNIWTARPFYSTLDPHLWSLPYELRASLHLYICLLIVGSCRKQVRLGLLLLFAVIYFYWNRWELWSFLLGAVVAQIDTMLPPVEPQLDGSTLPSGETGLTKTSVNATSFVFLPFSSIFRAARSRSGLRRLLFSSGISQIPLFLLAFYFLTYPLCCYSAAPGYVLLNRLIPSWMDRKDKFYSNIGTTLLIFLLCRSDPSTSKSHKLLNSAIPQYLGRISFSIYMCHGPVLNIIGFLLPNHIWWMLGIDDIPASMITWSLGIVLGWAFGLMLVLWAADVWSREVEGRCIKTVKYMEICCFQNP